MKETHYKLKHRVTALFAAAVMLCSMLPGAAFAEEPTPQPTEETVQMEQQTEPSETDNGQTDASSPDPGEDVTEATPETAEEQPAEEEIPAAVVGAELYTDLPNAPIGSYIGSEGLPVATGETKIGICEWPESQLEETSDSYLTAAALDNDGLTMAAPLLDGADYAIVPIMAQVEYPADGSSTDMILPDGVTLLDFYGEPATDADALLHNSYHETSAAVMGVYVQAAADFTAQLVYTDPDSSTQIKTLYVTIDREHTVASPFADAGIAAYGERPIPNVTSGKITKVAKVNSTWLIWFNGDEAYCCTPGADGQPKNCPTYTYVNTSMVGADQYVPGDHYGNQYRIWGGLTQLSLGMQELPPVALSAEAPSLLDFCRTIYTNAQMQIIENYPDSTAAKILMGSAQTLLEGTDAYASARGYYTYIYQPGRAGWQTVAVIGPEISDDEPNPKPIVQEIYANWEAPAQTASGSFDFDYGIITNKVQLRTTEKVDGATIEIEPITKSGTIDGGTWNISPADKQTVTTAGHTNDDNFQNNGGAASASWTLHYSVSKTTDSRSGRVGPYTTQDEADAAADSARDAAIAELQGEAQRMVDNAVASAKAELANVKFRYEEVGVPYGFEMYWGSNGSNQTISVPANSNNAYQMKNDEWSLQVNLKKTDSETGNQIAADAQYEIFQWDTVTGKYQPTGGYNTYSVQRQGNGTYAVINSAAYATTDSMRHTLYYTQRNSGKFIIVESKAPTGYFGDWTDINHPGIVNTPLGKRGYYIEITEDSDNSVIWLDNADYNADIAATDKGGTKLVTSTGVETTVTIYDTGKDSSRTFNTDNSGKAANEDSYTITPSDGVMKNDRTLGEISISKVDLDAVRYVGGSAAHGTALASGQAHGNAALDGAVYDLYAAEDITHPDGVTGVVDYSKIVDADGNSVWHTTIRDNSGQWVSDYLPVLKKDHLVASAEIENGWLCFSNLYLGKYYVVERSTGVVIPLRDGALAVSGTYPTVDSRTKAATGQTAALAKNGSGQYTDWVYKNQFSTVSKGKALDGSWTYDAYYLSFADGYLCDEHNYYITPAYSDEGWYVEKTTFADNRQAAGEQIDKTSYSANYHIHADNALAESQDQAAKGNVEISKIVSSSGQSNGLELEGAGFTFFLVSDLSKLKQFEQTRSGSYTLQSILDAYIDKTYDNEHPKWDFSAETQAIAKTYEVNADEIAAYNKTLTAAGENKNGKGDGWQPTGSANEYQLAEIFSNDTGNIRVQGLPYGTYLVVETTVPHDLFQAEPFIVTVDPEQDNNPWGAMATPKDSVMTGSDSYQKFTVLDEEIEVYLRITKVDEETGKPVLLPDTAFQIYWLDEQGHYRYDSNGNPKLVTMTDTVNGHLTKDVTTFYTNGEGILYLMYEAPASEQNFSTLMYMILNCQVSENEMVENPLMMLFGELERRDPQHPAVLQFKSFMLGAKKTLQSILISAAANLYMFNSRKFAEMTSRDEMFLPRMGLEQRALFIVLPDNDTTFNFIATMLYTQLFDQLFRLADSTPEYNGALPVHVRLMMDEFANVALPKNFKNILAVCRSRNISCDIILQNIAQLKSLFKDDWEGIIGNCDTLLYLGGNEYGTYEYLSKILGKETERTKSQSIGKGSRGSSSDSLQTAGRELCMPDEIRRMLDDECLLLMRSEDPVIDRKYNLLKHPNVKYTPDAGGEPYVIPPDYMGDAITITMGAVAAATAPEITEEMYEQLDYLEKHPEENYYENEENFSQYDQGD